MSEQQPTPIKTCICGACGETFFVRSIGGGTDPVNVEMSPRFCCYCGQEFSWAQHVNPDGKLGQALNMAGNPIEVDP